MRGDGSEEAHRTVAVRVARLTRASDTDGCRCRTRSMRSTHEAHVIPSMSRMTWLCVTNPLTALPREESQGSLDAALAGWTGQAGYRSRHGTLGVRTGDHI